MAILVIVIATTIGCLLASKYDDIASIVLFCGICNAIALPAVRYIIKNGDDVTPINLVTGAPVTISKKREKKLEKYADTYDGIIELNDIIREIVSIYRCMGSFFIHGGRYDKDVLVAILCARRGKLSEAVKNCGIFNDHRMSEEQIISFSNWICMTVFTQRDNKHKRKLKNWFVFDTKFNKYVWVTFPYYKEYCDHRYIKYSSLGGISFSDVFNEYTVKFVKFYEERDLRNEQKEERKTEGGC